MAIERVRGRVGVLQTTVTYSKTNTFLLLLLFRLYACAHPPPIHHKSKIETQTNYCSLILIWQFPWISVCKWKHNIWIMETMETHRNQIIILMWMRSTFRFATVEISYFSYSFLLCFSFLFAFVINCLFNQMVFIFDQNEELKKKPSWDYESTSPMKYDDEMIIQFYCGDHKMCRKKNANERYHIYLDLWQTSLDTQRLAGQRRLLNVMKNNYGFDS